MPNDATFDLMKEKMKSDSKIGFIQLPFYNIDDVEQPFAMIDLKLSGCFVLVSSKKIDPNNPGKIYLNNKKIDAPILLSISMFGQLIGIKTRKYLNKYNTKYSVKYSGALDCDGKKIDDFCFEITTMPKINQNDIFNEHNKVVLKSARESIVLLKNKNDVLPLQKNEFFNPFGSGCRIFHTAALGAGKINPRYNISIEDGIKYTHLKLNKNLYKFYNNEEDVVPGVKLVEKSKLLSKKAFMFISRTSSEAHDMKLEKGSYYLTDDELNLLKFLKFNFDKVIIVLNTAYQICLKEIIDLDVDAILWCGLPGMAGGRALMEIISGKVNPSGALSNSWCLDYDDYPSSENFFTTKNTSNSENISSLSICYSEGNLIGYKYFTDKNIQIPFIFGSGLSYTKFELKVLNFKKTNNNFEVLVNCKNIGNFKGKKIITLFAKLENEPIRLVSFEKTNEISPKCDTTVKLKFKMSDLTIFDKEQFNWIVKKGIIDIYLGELSNLSKIDSINIDKSFVYKKSKQYFKEPVEFKNNILSKSQYTKEFSNGEINTPIPFESNVKKTIKYKPLAKYDGKLITYNDLRENKFLLNDFVSQMSNEELVRIVVCGKTGWGMDDDGHAGEMAFTDPCLEKYGFGSFKMADGNNGLNLKVRNIGFPTSNLMCSSYNKKLMYEEGKAIAEEAKYYKIDCILAPAMNIQRNPLAGRNAEYFSEDPYLAGIMAGYQIKGLENNGVRTSLKHLLANNNEFKRNFTNCIIDEKTIREIYLKAFEYALSVKKPSTIMTSYNAVNGVYPCDNPNLLINVLRKEFKFNGIVMTDWNGYGNKGFSYMLKSGVNLITPGSENDSITSVILDDLKNSKIERNVLEKRVLEIFNTIIS